LRAPYRWSDHGTETRQLEQDPRGRLRAKSQVLEIEFSDGKLIQYRGVSPEVHRQFMAAPSATSFFEDKIDESFPSSRIK